ncbi:MAG TPA: twin-arginine translocase TatA/TatE family subunit [Acidimicrobiales bacterium]|nr:twin-arginine translocase TatA/TatE family subunit [Acidimicrobiales bacterium]
MIVANILGPDMGIIAIVLLLLFGGSQLPKLARSLGSASHEFRKGTEEGGTVAPVEVAPVSTNHSTSAITAG